MKQRKYLLDTNICIFFMKGKYGLDFKIKDVGSNNCFISSITVAELLYGAACCKNAKEEKKRVEKFISLLQIVPIDSCLNIYAESKAYLRKQGTPIDDFDLLIGSTALANGMIVVSDNIKHLGKIPNIQLENWVAR